MESLQLAQHNLFAHHFIHWLEDSYFAVLPLAFTLIVISLALAALRIRQKP